MEIEELNSYILNLVDSNDKKGLKEAFETIPAIDIANAIDEIEDVIGLEAQDAPLISAKNDINVEELPEK